MSQPRTYTLEELPQLTVSGADTYRADQAHRVAAVFGLAAQLDYVPTEVATVELGGLPDGSGARALVTFERAGAVVHYHVESWS